MINALDRNIKSLSYLHIGFGFYNPTRAFDLQGNNRWNDALFNRF